MNQPAQDILAIIESLKTTIEACIKKQQVSKSEHDRIMDGLRNALVIAGTLAPNTQEPAGSMEDRIIEKLSVVIDSIIDRRMAEYRTQAIETRSPEKAVEPAITEPIAEEPITQKEEPKPSEKKAQADDKKGDGKTFYETIAEKNKPGKSVYDILSKDTATQEPSGNIPGRKIPDLEKAISLNEKFVFIKELFGGNAHQYSQAVVKLNTMKDMEEALNLIQSEYSWWDSKDMTVKSFMDLIRRRYM